MITCRYHLDPMKAGPIYRPETSVINNQSTVRNIPEERKLQLASLQRLQQKQRVIHSYNQNLKRVFFLPLNYKFLAT